MLNKVSSHCGYYYIILVISIILPCDCLGNQDDVYPDTPEAVVQKFCQLDAEGMRISGDTMDRILKYVTWRETGADEIDVIDSFKVKKAVINDSKARVSVEYKMLGSTDGMKFLESKRTYNVTFKLSKNGKWKIDEPIILPKVHWKTTIAHMKRILKGEPTRKKELEAIIDKINKTASTNLRHDRASH